MSSMAAAKCRKQQTKIKKKEGGGDEGSERTVKEKEEKEKKEKEEKEKEVVCVRSGKLRCSPAPSKKQEKDYLPG